jgi:glutathione S-transferase
MHQHTRKLFGLEQSVYTRIARLAFEEKEIAYELSEVEIFGQSGVPEEHFKRHPFGRIPALQHGPLILYETNAITRYIDEAFVGPALQPSDAAQRARMNQAISLLDAYAYRPMVWGGFVQRVRIPINGGIPDETIIAKSLKVASTCLSALSALRGSDQFIAGDSLILADLHAFPILRYFCLAPEGRALLSSFSTLSDWYEAMLQLASVARTVSPYERDCHDVGL